MLVRAELPMLTIVLLGDLSSYVWRKVEEFKYRPPARENYSSHFFVASFVRKQPSQTKRLLMYTSFLDCSCLTSRTGYIVFAASLSIMIMMTLHVEGAITMTKKAMQRAPWVRRWDFYFRKLESNSIFVCSTPKSKEQIILQVFKFEF